MHRKQKNLVLEVWHINYWTDDHKLISYELKDFLCCHVLCWYGLWENPLPPNRTLVCARNERHWTRLKLG